MYTFPRFFLLKVLSVGLCLGVLLSSCSADMYAYLLGSSEADSPLLGSLEYSIGDIGPAGGYIFYDKGSYIDGWRYLEAAPHGWCNDIYDLSYFFGYYMPAGNGLEVGTGEPNTIALSTMYVTLDSAIDWEPAAKKCIDYRITVGGISYDDWFLPSRDELNLMYENLHLHNLGNFTASSYYWSSSVTEDRNFAWGQCFANNQKTILSIRYSGAFRVRPVRSF